MSEIGNHLLSDSLNSNDKQMLTEVLTEYQTTISVITEKIHRLDPDTHDIDRMLLCALQIREICLMTLYRTSPTASSAAPVDTHTILSDSIEKVATIRNVKLEQLQVLVNEKLHSNIVSLNSNLSELCTAYGDSYEKVSPHSQVATGFVEPTDEELSARQVLIERRRIILEKIEGLSYQLKEFHINPENLQFTIEITPHQLNLQIERIKNKIVTSQLFIQNINTFFNENKEVIVRQFTNLEKFTSFEICEIKPIDPSLETHNGAREPMEIIFRVDGTQVRCLLKPRRADIDLAVINTFRQLNSNSKDAQRDLDCLLPEYVIVQPEKGDGWREVHGLEEVSLWQLIEGEDIQKSMDRRRKERCGGAHIKTNAYQYAIRNRKTSPNMLKSLKRMATIFSKMEIIDQHYENILVDNLIDDKPTETSRLIPIDLEARGLGDSGLQVPVNKRTALRDGESDCIQKNFLDVIRGGQYTERILIIGTDKLAKLIVSCLYHDKQIDVLSKTIHNDFSKEYTMVDHKKLIPHIIEDFLNGDVPYLSENRGLLYYGLPSRGVVIGRKPKRSGE